MSEHSTIEGIINLCQCPKCQLEQQANISPTDFFVFIVIMNALGYSISISNREQHIKNYKRFFNYLKLGKHFLELIVSYEGCKGMIELIINRWIEFRLDYNEFEPYRTLMEELIKIYNLKIILPRYMLGLNIINGIYRDKCAQRIQRAWHRYWLIPNESGIARVANFHYTQIMT